MVQLQDIVSELSSALNIAKDLFYSTRRNRQGSLGRAEELVSYSFKGISGHFNRDPVVMRQGIKKLEQKIREEEGIAMAITKLREAPARDKSENT